MIHNPDNLEPTIGYRFLEVGEVIPNDAEFFNGKWRKTTCSGERLEAWRHRETYRTSTKPPLTLEDKLRDEVQKAWVEGYDARNHPTLSSAPLAWRVSRAWKVYNRELP